MKFKNIIVSFLIVIFGCMVFTGCNANVSLKLSVNSAEGSVICSADVSKTVTSSYTFKIKKNTKVTVSAIAKNGYAFQGWNNGKTQESDHNPYEFNIKKNKTLKATFYKINYTINFVYNTLTDSEGQTNKDSLQNVKVGDSVTFPVINDTETVDFLGWYYKNEITETETKISDGGATTMVIPTLTTAENQNKTFTVFAKFRTARTVTFNIAGDISTVPCYVGEAIDFPTVDEEGYHFSGWLKSDSSAYTSSTLLEDADLTLTADLRRIYTVSFQGGEQDEQPVEVWYEKVINLPTYEFVEEAPTKFKGWTYNNELYTDTFTFTGDSNITLVAKVSNRYTISYYSNGGDVVVERYIYQDDNFSESTLPVPTRTTGCSETNAQVPTFRCWTYKNQPVTAETVFTADHDISLVAQWNIYYIAIQYQSQPPINNGAVAYFGATGDQLLKDVIPYTALEQASYITSQTQMLNATGDAILFFTLNNMYGYNYKLSNIDLYSTVAEFCAKARTMQADGIDSEGFVYTDNLMAEEFVFADDYGTPVITTDATGTAYEIQTTNWASILYAAYNNNNA